MKITKNIFLSTLIIMMIAGTFSSCVKKDYDDLQTANVDPDLTPTHTIKQLQEMTLGQAAPPMEITDDIIIAGVVTGDDRTGNLYKKVILQQDSSGIAVQVDISNFYTEYPTGRRVFVKCKGLFLKNNGGNFELGISGTSPVGRIPAGLISNYLVKGMWGQYLTPMVFNFNSPNIPTNTLVTFNDVQFDCGFNGIAYAASSPANLDMIDCNNNRLILYSSTFATFALATTPTGKGSITGVYTVYNNAGELQIRDTNDVSMRGLRCDGTTGVAGLKSLAFIRSLDPGAANTLTLPCDMKIRVTVISDYTTKMLDAASQNIYVQDSTGGIEIRFDQSHVFQVGSEIEVSVGGQELSTYKGVLQMNNVPIGGAVVVGPGETSARTATIQEIFTNYAEWEGTLVKINNVTITGTGTYNGSAGVNTLTDPTGNIELYTTSGATFTSVSYPTGVVSVTGILTEYDAGTSTKEILIRNPNDVQ